MMRSPEVAAFRSGRFAITAALAVEDHRLGDAAYRVLACLGTYADRHGWCWPSTATLAQRLGITRQAVQRSLRQLAELAYIEVERRRRPDGAHDRNRYRLLFDRALFEIRNKASEDADAPQHDVAPPMQHDVAGMQRGRGGACTVGDTPSIEERTHSNGSVGSNEPTAGAAPADLKKEVYATGETILGRNTGGIVTKLLKHCDGDCRRAMDLLRLCGRKNNPREYANGLLRGDVGPRAESVLAETERLYREMGVS